MNTDKQFSRKEFLASLAAMAGMVMLPGTIAASPFQRRLKPRIQFGMVTYLWGKDWDLPTLIDNLTKAEVYGVELRIGHAHGVNVGMSKDQRKEVRKMFRGSDVEVLGIGTPLRLDHPDQSVLRETIDQARECILLSNEIGGSGIRLQPNQFHADVPKSRTVDQIGRALNQLARIGAGVGQQIRLEVHGEETQEIDIIKDIMDVADHPNATVCWNSNPQDLLGRGLTGNFNLLRSRIGDISHVRELDDTTYPYEELVKLFVDTNYRGWVLLEGRSDPANKVEALIAQRKIFEEMVEKAIIL